MARVRLEDIGDARRTIAWSAYDPTEGRMDSDDPLGFAGAALRLAERILPGLTVRTLSLGYYPMVCAGLLAVEEASDDTERRRGFMVWEKVWALARVATDQGRGVLGVNGAGRHLASQHRARLDGHFVLLQRQPFLGALGSYGTSLEALELKAVGSLRLTDAGRTLAIAALKEAASRMFWRNLLDATRESIRRERDHIDGSSRYGVSHERLAAVGRLNPSISATLRGRLFDPLTTRGRATRLVLTAIRDADIPDLAALQVLASRQAEEAVLATLAGHALVLEDITCAANFALERILGAAVANGYAISPEAVLRDEPRWPEIERRLRSAAARAANGLADADFPYEQAAALVFAELSGADLVKELVGHHERVMRGRSARRWASFDGDRIHAHRVATLPAEPEPIRHAYRFASARTLAVQAGLAA